jgi:uncharacterized damage-inducible protein DinB
MTAEHFRFLARYNSWINEKLYAASANAPDRERKADRGAFFGSLHGTLNHLLLADRVWMGRFENTPYAAPGLDAELYADFAQLRAARVTEDARIVRWTEQLDDHTLAGTLRYTSMVNPAPRTYVYWQAATHFFNHQTHHRGQVTTLLTQMGIDYGVTDMIGMPGVTLA